MEELLYVSQSFANYNYPLKQSDVVFLGVPFSSTGSSKSAHYGPVMVREMMKVMSGGHKDFDIFEDLKYTDVGDLDVSWGSYEITAKRIRKTIREIKEKNKNIFPIFVGGEHLITLPIVQALKPKTIIQFDAHSDAFSEIEEAKYSHGTWAYHASKSTKIVQIGVRHYSDDEENVVKKNKMIIFDPEDDISKLKLKTPIHISMDIDVFSPEYIETGHPEGNLKPEQIFKILENIKSDSLDICEIADDKLPSKTGMLASEIIKRVIYSRFV